MIPAGTIVPVASPSAVDAEAASTGAKLPAVSAEPSEAPSSTVPPGLAQWFSDEVHAHEPRLRAFVRVRFPSLRDVDDVVQESYLRIWRTRLRRPIDSTRDFLFRIAQHLAIDLLRRAETARTDNHCDLSLLAVYDGLPDAAETLTYREKIQWLAEALAELPTRCRRIIVLRKFENVSVRL